MAKVGNGKSNNGPTATDDIFHLQTVDTTVMSFIMPGAQVLANDTVKNGQSLSIISAQAGNGATAVQILPSGDLQVFPSNPYAPTDTFQYTISDGHGGTSTATVFVDYQVANSPPVAAPDDINVPTGAQSVGILPSALLNNDSDPNGDPVHLAGFLSDFALPITGVQMVTTPQGNLSIEVDFSGPIPAGSSPTFHYLLADSHDALSVGTVTIHAV